MVGTRSLLQRPVDLIYFVFFNLSILGALLLNVALIIPLRLVPEALIQFHQAWVNHFKDPFTNIYYHQSPELSGSRYYELIYLRAFICLMFCFQFPFYFYASYQLYQDRKFKIRIPGIIYSSHVMTTVVPFLASIVTGLPTHTTQEKWTLLSLYLPYLVLPLVLLLDLLTITKPDTNKKLN